MKLSEVRRLAQEKNKEAGDKLQVLLDDLQDDKNDERLLQRSEDDLTAAEEILAEVYELLTESYDLEEMAGRVMSDAVIPDMGITLQQLQTRIEEAQKFKGIFSNIIEIMEHLIFDESPLSIDKMKDSGDYFSTIISEYRSLMDEYSGQIEVTAADNILNPLTEIETDQGLLTTGTEKDIAWKDESALLPHQLPQTPSVERPKYVDPSCPVCHSDHRDPIEAMYESTRGDMLGTLHFATFNCQMSELSPNVLQMHMDEHTNLTNKVARA